MPSSPVARSKRDSTSPVAAAPAKRQTRSSSSKLPEPIAITQPEEMEWELLTAEKRAKAPDMEENIETSHADHTDDDRKQPAKKPTPPPVETAMVNNANDDEEHDYQDCDDEEGDVIYDDKAPPSPCLESIRQANSLTVAETTPNFLNRNIVSWNHRNDASSPSNISKFIERWSEIAKDPSSFMASIRLMSGNDNPPIMFLALDKADDVVTVLHHFELFRSEAKPPQLTALVDDRYENEDPQTVFLQPNEICATVEFALPLNVSDADIATLGATNSTLPSPRNKPKQSTPLLVPLHPSWAPLFLHGGLPEPACDIHFALIQLLTGLEEFPTACNLVKTSAWGLITRTASKHQPAIVAIPIKVPRVSQEFLVWRSVSLPGLFQSVDLLDDDDPTPRSEQVNHAPDFAGLEHPPATSQPVNLSPDSAAYGHNSSRQVTHGERVQGRKAKKGFRGHGGAWRGVVGKVNCVADAAGCDARWLVARCVGRRWCGNACLF